MRNNVVGFVAFGLTAALAVGTVGGVGLNGQESRARVAVSVDADVTPASGSAADAPAPATGPAADAPASGTAAGADPVSGPAVGTDIGGSDIAGGWQVAADTTVTDKVKELVTKALNGMVGVTYEPVAYLASQVVAGTNHCILCRATVVYPGSTPYYVLMYIYEDLSGNCQLMNIETLDIPGPAGVEETPDWMITFNKAKLILKKGKSAKIKAYAEVSGMDNVTLVWKSSNKKIATVNKNGKVTAKKKGTCKITCRIKEIPGAKAVVKVKVK